MFRRSYLKLKFGLIFGICTVKFCIAQGPTAPEASSFEPVDASDMVDLLTGDLSYVIPVLSVPSPEGGYPIALSYHGGIAMEQEASWVGLGWNINPGAINRSVLGYPDDWKREKVSKLIYDAGGEIISNDLSISVGWGDGLYSVGLYSSWGSNRSINGESSTYSYGGISGSAYGITARLGTDGLGVGLSASQDYGNANSSFSGSVSGSVGINYGWNGSIKGNISFNATGSSFDTNSAGGGTGVNVSAEGSFSFGKNKNSNSLTTSYTMKTTSYSLNVCNILDISYSHSIIKYWLAQKRTSEVVGSLYASYLDEMLDSSLSPDRQDFDSYEVLNHVKIKNSYNDNNLSFLAKDSYSVNAQGIYGNISSSFQDFGSIFFQRKMIDDRDYNTDDINTYAQKYNFTKSIDSGNLHFYFDNEYSSFIALNTSGSWDPINSSYPSISSLINDLDVSSFELNTVYSDSEGNNHSNYNSVSKRIAKGSYIETFTNKQIKNSNVLYFNDIYENRNFAEEDGIGAFIITAMDGKRYLYTLPVYQKEKFERSSGIEDDIENKFYEEQSLTPYATHWLLTAVLGTDYVDANFNNEIDEDDFGYWVTFDYGKWSDGFVWRTPTTDFQESDSSKKFSWGIKEIYYLDKIKTRTHTAFFFKDLRLDGRSNTEVQIGTSRSNPKSFQEIGLGWMPTIDLFTANGHFYFSSTYDNFSTNDITTGGCSLWNTTYKVTNNYFVNSDPHHQLRLNRIVLIQNDLIPASFNKTVSGIGEKIVSEIQISERVQIENDCDYQDFGTTIIHDKNYYGEYIGKIYDMEDYNLFKSEFEEKSEKTINFIQDYSLASNTPNANTGKLTLKKLQYISKHNSSLIPPYIFDYYSGIYQRNNIDDWGYRNSVVQSNSLSSIVTPLGSEIKIQYEEDDFHQTAAQTKRILSNGLMYYITCSSINSDIFLEISNDLDLTTTGLDSFIPYFDINEITNLSLFICRKENYGSHDRIVTLNLDEVDAQVLAVNNESVTLKVNGNSNFWYENDQDLSWITGRKWSKSGVYHANGDPDGVIIRNNSVEEYTCYKWRDGNYENSDVTFFYDLVASSSLVDQEGGGLRVKNIEMLSDNGSYKKEYFYNEPGFDKFKIDQNYRSSGITSYVPSKYPQVIPYQSELPSPYVMYKNVAVKSDEMTTYYTFKVLEPISLNGANLNMGDIINIDVNEEIETGLETTSNYQYTLSKKTYVISDNLSSIGSLIEKEIKNNKDQSLSKEKYTYKSLNAQSQGINIESFNTYEREISYSNSYVNVNTNITSKIKFPHVIESIETLKSGHSSEIIYNDFDFNTGLSTETITFLSDGTILRNNILPAYNKYSEMGSKVENILNKNMLSQETLNSSFVYLNGDWQPTGVGITTWNNEWWYRNGAGFETTPTLPEHEIWRKYQTYFWDGEINQNGTFYNYNIANFDGFDWASDIQPEPWKKISQVERYDHYSIPIEQRDINNNYVSTKIGDKDSKIIATSNAKYTEMYYSGAEHFWGTGNNYFDGEVSGAYQSEERSHTGKFSIKISTGQQGFALEMKGEGPRGIEHRIGKYVLSVWANKENYQNARAKIDGVVQPFNGEIMTAGNWVQMNHYFDILNSIDDVEISLTSASGIVYFDDFRILPISSSMTSYVYNEFDELTFILGSNNLGTKYQYDNAGRLIKIFEEIVDAPTISGGFKLAKEYRYNYSNVDNSTGGCEETIALYDFHEDPMIGESWARLYFPYAGTLTIKCEAHREAPSPPDTSSMSGQFMIKDSNGIEIFSEAVSLGGGTNAIEDNEMEFTIPITQAGVITIYNMFVSHHRPGQGYSQITLLSATPSICIDHPNYILDKNNDE